MWEKLTGLLASSSFIHSKNEECSMSKTQAMHGRSVPP